MRAEFISILNHDGQYQNALKRYNDIFTPAVRQSLDSIGIDYQSSKDASYSYIWHRHTKKSAWMPTSLIKTHGSLRRHSYRGRHYSKL